MEIRALANRLVTTDVLERKLEPPPARLTDDDPGPPVVHLAPGRPPDLALGTAAEVRVPPLAGMADPAQRARILHAFANHELQAAELFAWGLLAFPDAPAEMRRGLVGLLADEQRHARLYLDRLAHHGQRFGAFGVSGYFWSKVPLMGTPLRFLCAMCLTFENANLDHSVAYAEAAREAGDDATADVLDRVHADEKRHVRFGLHWVGELAGGDRPLVDVYLENVAWPLRPALARGRHFGRELREELGFAPEFIELLGEAGSR